MYQFTLTSTEYPLHTVVNIDLWDVEPNGSRTLLRLDHIFLPEPAEGLFERDQQEFLALVVRELEKWVSNTRHTDQ